MTHRFTDAVAIAGTNRTQDGYLVADAFVARSGIQLYRGADVGLDDKPVVRVWRPEDEVMNPASVRTYSHAPITMGHPPQFVDATNWKDLAKGEIGEEAAWVDGKLRLPLIMKDADTIAAIESGTRQLSAGYTSEIEFADGQTPDGEPYDAIQRNIRINHVAVVPKGRAGEQFRIGDGADHWGAAPITLSDKKEDPMSDALKTVVLGDEAAQVAVADAAKVEKFKADQAKRISDIEDKHAKEIATKDAAIAKIEAERDDLKAKVLSDADLDARVAARADLIGKAKAISDADYSGKSEAEIRKYAVSAKLGDEAIKDKSDAYIEARFDILAEDAATSDPLSKHMKAGPARNTNDARTVADEAYAENVTNLNNAWMGVQKEA